jgi:mRNA interferase MazF
MDTTKKDFQGWCKKKISLNDTDDKKTVYFRGKEIWWCALGVNIGFEQDGKNHNYERPVLILKKINRYLALAIPLSTKIKDHPYYIRYKQEGIDYSALILQMRVISSKRLLRRVGRMNTEVFQGIVESTKQFVEKK